MKFLLFPFSLIYGFFIAIRNLMFNSKLLKQKQFDVNIIAIGNLSAGGTGKSPMVEYILKLCKENNNIATLSRGYGRKTKGFLLADEMMTWRDIGDEPLQFYQKFKEIPIAVDSSRKRGISEIMKKFRNIKCVVLDDAYQHRWVERDLNILLTTYGKPFYKNFLLPVGHLREPRRNYNRADVIVITKSPIVLSPIAERMMLDKLKPKPHQKVFFSFIKYKKFVQFCGPEYKGTLNYLNTIVMFSGIANHQLFEEELRKKTLNLHCFNFGDHHSFSNKEIDQIITKYKDQFTKKKIIVTTEKDAMRIKGTELFDKFKNIPVFYLPMETCIHNKSDEFNKIITKYATKDKGNN